MSSKYVYTGPADSQTINSFELSPLVNKPATVQNIVTAELDEESNLNQYSQIELNESPENSTCDLNQKVSKVKAGNAVVDIDLDGSTLNPKKKVEAPQSLLIKAEKWAETVTPEQWKKYALYAGIALIGKKILLR